MYFSHRDLGPPIPWERERRAISGMLAAFTGGSILENVKASTSYDKTVYKNHPHTVCRSPALRLPGLRQHREGPAGKEERRGTRRQRWGYGVSRRAVRSSSSTRLRDYVEKAQEKGKKGPAKRSESGDFFSLISPFILPLREIKGNKGDFRPLQLIEPQ